MLSSCYLFCLFVTTFRKWDQNKNACTQRLLLHIKSKQHSCTQVGEIAYRKQDAWNLSEKLELIGYFPSLNSYFCFSSAKSSHPKKTGCTTKTLPAPTSTSTLPTRSAKDTRSAARNGATDTKTNRKSDTPTSSVPEKASTETPSQPGELKSSPVSSDAKPASPSRAEDSRAASPPGQEPKVVPKAPEPTDQSLPNHAATKDTSVTPSRETDSCSKEEKQERTREEGGEGDVKKAETESAQETKPR